jgi:hypothetical protein
MGGNDPQLFVVDPYQPHLRNLDLLVDSGFLADGFLL